MTDFSADVDCCLEVLRTGGIILYPTDTVWGLGCDATNEAAVEKIYRLKQRPGNKNMILLVADEKSVLQYVTQPEPGIFDYLKTTSRPTTVIYNGAIGIAANLSNEAGTIAIRITRDAFCKHLIKRFRKPVVSTSANLSGQPTPFFFRDILEEIKAGADYIVQYRRDDLTVSEPSSIISWNKDGSITTIR